jgi:hypothetical protein
MRSMRRLSALAFLAVPGGRGYARGEMNPQGDETLPGTAEEFRDRSLGLVVFGVIEILIGAFCALLVPLSLLAWWIADREAGEATSLRSTLPVVVIYLITAVLFVWLGVGSIRARRWACDLMLAISRIWLVTGVCTLLLSWLVLPGFLRGVGVTGGFSSEVLSVAIGVTFAIVSLIYVVLPGAFVLFYRSPAVIATCRARDPRPQFTDDCPPRVLTLSVVWGMAAISVVAMPAYDWAFPFFGRLLLGAAGAVPWIGVLAVCAGLGWGSCRRRPWAWWGAVAATVAAAVSTVLTSMRMSPAAMIRALPIAEDQMRVLTSVSWPGGWVIALLWIAVWGSMLVYLLTLRPYFVDD